MDDKTIVLTTVEEVLEVTPTEVVVESKRFAVVENGVVTNVIVADDEFAAYYTNHPELPGECHEYVEQHEDDTNVARIGDLHINGKFVSTDQAMDLGLIPDTRPKPIITESATIVPAVETTTVTPTIPVIPTPIAEQAKAN